MALARAAHTAHHAPLAPLALNAEGKAPEWVELVPAGAVVGRDGRSWVNDQAGAVIEAYAANGALLPIDWEHATEHRAPKGEPAPAAGWIAELSARAGAIWGRVEWTERAAQQIEKKEYRYLSPVFRYERESRRIVALLSAGLTNQPNLHLTALNHADPGEDMKLTDEMRRALGLEATATEAEALVAINRLTKPEAGKQPSLDTHVPRADYDHAINRASAAERELETLRTQRRDAEVESAIDAALKAGKITPATADYHRAQCKTEGGLDRFKAFAEAAPAIAQDSALAGKPSPDGAKKALNAETREIARRMGVSVEDIHTHGLTEEG